MRKSRLRYDKEGSYYHLFNRIGGESNYLPFGNSEKSQLERIIMRLRMLYSVEILSYCIMGNHFHACVYATDELPTPSEVEARYYAYYEQGRPALVGKLRCQKNLGVRQFLR